MKRSNGSFVRSFAWLDDAEDSRVSAKFKDGVMLVPLTNSEAAKPNRIEVKMA